MYYINNNNVLGNNNVLYIYFLYIIWATSKNKKTILLL